MSKKRFDPIINVEDDGLIIPEVGVWSIEKYQLLGGYCDIFTRGMRKLWSNLIYIDLYAGAGYSKIRDNNQILKSSPLIALSVPVKFDKYIFCEENSTSINALSQRIKREYSEMPVQLIEGDCNVRVDDIKNAIPKYSKSNTVLAFCFSDP